MVDHGNHFWERLGSLTVSNYSSMAMRPTDGIVISYNIITVPPASLLFLGRQQVEIPSDFDLLDRFEPVAPAGLSSSSQPFLYECTTRRKSRRTAKPAKWSHQTRQSRHLHDPGLVNPHRNNLLGQNHLLVRALHLVDPSPTEILRLHSNQASHRTRTCMASSSSPDEPPFLRRR